MKPDQTSLLISRLTWFAGIIIFAIGTLTGQDGMMIAAGLAIAAGTISMALLARSGDNV
jgi:hypothetical protein